MSLDPLACEPRWVAWRSEARGGATTKVPYAPKGGRAKADDPSTWGIRTEAAARAQQIVNGGGSGGIGIELGDLGGDVQLAGIDLDSCLAADRTLADWARPILTTASSYTEVSPSGHGLKVFFYCKPEDVRRFLELVGVTDPKRWGLKRAIGEDGRDHGPAIEIYFAARYFTVTGDRWMTQPDTVTLLDWPTLGRLAELVPPARSLEKAGALSKAGADNSRSAAAFRKGAALRCAGKTFDEMVALLRADPETADWCREKGDQRQLQRIWERAVPEGDRGRTIRVSAGLRHRAADNGLAAMLAAGIPFYQRDRMLVRVCGTEAKASDGRIVTVPAILPVTSAMLGRALGIGTMGQDQRQERADSDRSAQGGRRTNRWDGRRVAVCAPNWRHRYPNTATRWQPAFDRRL
jgi:hypothetical protein